MRETSNIKNLKAQQWLIWFALLMSLGMLAVVLAVQPAQPPSTDGAFSVTTAATISVVLGILSLVIPSMVPKNAPSSALTRMLLGLAIAESAAIIGFVYAFSTGQGVRAFWPFLAGAAALYFVHRPKQD
jgi:F0F1-type ATP synthase membrane subunit c/vacuolar-type H+-ATPase subunit K